MKKTLALIFLTVLLILLCAVLLASCNSDEDSDLCVAGHIVETWKVTLKPTCEEKGEQEGVCTVCGKTVVKEIEPTGHTHWQWRVDVEPTCTHVGMKSSPCTVCGKIVEVEIPKTKHTVNSWQITTAATCMQEGKRSGTCTVCGQTLEEKIDIVAHEAGPWVTTIAPTATTAGEHVKYCTMCHQVVQREAMAPNPIAANLPADLNWNGEQIHILHWSDPENPEFEEATITGDKVRNAIFERNNNIEDRLNVELKWYGQPGDGGNISSFVKHVEAQYNNGTQMYDLVIAYSRTIGLAAINGYLYNLATITENNYMDLSKPWWPPQLVETVNFGDDYYFISGDMSNNVLYMMRCIFYNKDLFTRYQLESPYTMVYDGKWTLDKMIEITSDRFEELDGNNQPSDGDMYGFVSCDYICSSFIPGSNLRCIDDNPGEGDVLMISPDYGSAKMVKLVNKLGNWMATDSVRIHWGDVESIDTRGNVTGAFSKGKSLMLIGHSVNARSYSSQQNFNFGIMPVPKYDEKQVNYYTGMGNPYSLYSIFVDFRDREGQTRNETLSMLSSVLECWASEGYRLTTPEIFEVNMQLKYSAGQDETNMFEYIRSGITFDLGQIFDAYVSVISERPVKAACGNASWSSSYGAYKNTMSKQLHQLCENFRTYQAERDNKT